MVTVDAGLSALFLVGIIAIIVGLFTISVTVGLIGTGILVCSGTGFARYRLDTAAPESVEEKEPQAE